MCLPFAWPSKVDQRIARPTKEPLTQATISNHVEVIEALAFWMASQRQGMISSAVMPMLFFSTVFLFWMRICKGLSWLCFGSFSLSRALIEKVSNSNSLAGLAISLIVFSMSVFSTAARGFPGVSGMARSSEKSFKNVKACAMTLQGNWMSGVRIRNEKPLPYQQWPAKYFPNRPNY